MSNNPRNHFRFAEREATANATIHITSHCGRRNPTTIIPVNGFQMVVFFLAGDIGKANVSMLQQPQSVPASFRTSGVQKITESLRSQ